MLFTRESRVLILTSMLTFCFFMKSPWVGGIAPGPDGAYSIALSGGYDDDVDEGYAL